MKGFKKIESIDDIMPGQAILGLNGYFGELVSITPKGKYSVRYDIDYYGEPRTYFSKKSFAEFFLIKEEK